MALTDVISQIDLEIARLQQARALLAHTNDVPTPPRPRGRPPKSASTSTDSAAKQPSTKRQLSPEGRKAIADAMKRRWAERRSKTQE